MADDGSEKMNAEKMDAEKMDTSEEATEKEPSEKESNITNEDYTEESKLSDTNLSGSETKPESGSKQTSSISLGGEMDAGSKQEDEKEEIEKEVAEEKDVIKEEESRSVNKAESSRSVNKAESSRSVNKAESSQSVNKAESSRSVNKAESSRSVNRAESSQSVNKAEESRSVNKAEESRSVNKAEESQSAEQRTKSTSTAVTPKDSEVSILTTSDSTAQTSDSSMFSGFTVHETVAQSSGGRGDSTEASLAGSIDDEREGPSSAEKYAQQAHTLVNMVITSATKHLVQESMCRHDTMAEIEVELFRGQTLGHMTPTYEDATVENIEWLTVEEFTVDRGTAKIEEFIEKTWVYQDNWLFCTDHLGKEEFDYDTRYRYRVRWSVPTRRKPIPRATASVYFTFSVSKVKPRDYPVDVYYVFEINRLVHRPGESRFRERWLKDIIESKVITMKGIHF